METLKIERQNVRMIAHRGLSGLETENTVEAFIAAANRTYYGIECDIHITKDQEFVVIHDDNTKRIGNKKLIIKDSTYLELLNVDLYDYLFEKTHPLRKIPRLQDYLNICKKYEKVAIIELKPRFTYEQIKRLLTILNEYNYLSSSIIISFDLENLINIRKINKDITIQYLVNEFNDEVLNNCLKYHFDIDINHQNLSKEIVQILHQNNIKVNTYTVNNPIVALMLVTWDVDFITTNILE